MPKTICDVKHWLDLFPPDWQVDTSITGAIVIRSPNGTLRENLSIGAPVRDIPRLKRENGEKRAVRLVTEVEYLDAATTPEEICEALDRMAELTEKEPNAPPVSVGMFEILEYVY